MKASKQLILIKLGGSIITEKSKTKTANMEKISQLANELQQVIDKTDCHIILGHGGGSFPHHSAAKYGSADGVSSDESYLGMAHVRFDAMELNQIVTAELIKLKVPAFTLSPSSFMTTKNKKLSQISVLSLVNLLKTKTLPVVYGDIITDEKIGCTIYSTETILNILAETLPEFGYSTKLIIEIGKTDGVYDQDGKTIPVIDKTNYNQIQHLFKQSESTDVTGGMSHKVAEAFELAQKGIPTLIISADLGNLEKAILGEEVLGTWIK